MEAAAETAITALGPTVTALGTAALAVVALMAIFALAKGMLKRSH